MSISPTFSACTKASAAALLVLFIAGSAGATDYYWFGASSVIPSWADSSPGGPGVWSTSGNTFRTSSSFTLFSGHKWSSSSGIGKGAGDDTAVFHGESGRVSLSGLINANGLRFTTSGYSITGTASNQLSLVGQTPTITVGTGTSTSAFTASISAPIAGTVGMTKAGAGTLVLSGANTYTGLTNVGGGTLRLAAGGQLYSGAAANAARTVTVAAGAMLNNAGTINGSVTVGNRGTFLNDAGTVAGAVTVNGTLYGTGAVGALTLNSTGHLSVGGAAGSIGTLNTGALTLNGGSYAFDFGSGGSADRINVDGGITFGSGIINLLLNSSAFDGRTSGQWTLFDSTSTISGFAPSAWAIDDDLLGAHAGTFSVGVSATDNTALVLSYTAIPEPQTYALFFGIGTFGIIAVRRWRAMRR